MSTGIVLLSQKGGVGKSTLAVNLAAAGHLAGLRTGIIDMDKQGSAIDWAAARSEGSKLDGLPVSRWDKPMPLARYQTLTSGFDLILIDTPPRLSEIVRTAAVAADIILIAVTPGGFDLWAVSETLDLLNEAARMRSDLGKPAARVVFVVNRASHTNLSRSVPGKLSGAGEICPVVIHHRVAFAASVTTGECVLTTEPNGAAAQEINDLYTYLTGASA